MSRGAVGDFFEKKAARGGGPSRDGEFGFTGEKFAKLIERDFAEADFDEGADNAADHFPEEVGGFDAEENQVVGGADFGGGDDDDGGFAGLGVVGLGEVAEVVAAGEERGGVGHGLEVEAVLDPPDLALVEGGFAGGDLVEVGAGGGVVAGVEVRVGFLEVENDDVGGEEFVEVVTGAFRGKGDFAAKTGMGDLGEGVDAGVGAARSHEFNRLAKDLFAGFLEGAGDRAGVRLFLPAVIIRTIKLNRELPSLHQSSC